MLALLGTSAVMADDWPQWLGPQRDGVWREEGIRKELKTPASVMWRKPIGWGYSGPTVAKGRVYVTDVEFAEDDKFDGKAQGGRPRKGVERVLCFDANSGKRIWKHEYEVTYTISYPGGPRVSPTVQDGLLYFQGAMGHFCCLDAESGEVKWELDVCAKYKCDPPRWGYASHPLVYRGLVFVAAGGDRSVLLALDCKTGKEKWRALSSDEAGYCPPRVIRFADVEQLLFWYPKAVVSLNPATGITYWSVDLEPIYGISRMAPRQLGNKLFVCGPDHVAAMLELESDRPSAKVLWRGERKNAVYCLNSPPHLVDGIVYGVDGETSALIAASMKDGERLWSTTKASLAPGARARSRHGSAFLVYHEANKQFWIFGEMGDLILAELSANQYREVGRQHVLEPTNGAWGRKVVWSQPAFAMKSMFARNDKELIRVDLSE